MNRLKMMLLISFLFSTFPCTGVVGKSIENVLVTESLNISETIPGWSQQDFNSLFTTKPLTNLDVIRMVKAGLSEDVIIRAIETSETNFDVTVDGLIQLSGGGVSQRVIQIMQRATSRENGDQSIDRQPDSTTAEDGMGPNTGGKFFIGDVKMLDGESETLMKRALQKSDGSIKGTTFIPFVGTFIGGFKSHWVLNRNHAQLRSTNNSIRFIVTLPSDINPADMVVLVKLKSKSDTRRIQSSDTNAIKGFKTGFREKDIVAISVISSGVKATNSNSATTYSVTVLSLLSPGEYARAIGGYFYDFGIDKSD